MQSSHLANKHLYCNLNQNLHQEKKIVNFQLTASTFSEENVHKDS